jgi:cephalosporin hydroxylase
VHGGTTTNQAEVDERMGRIYSYAQHYEDLRGREFRGPGKRLHYIGAMHPAGLRTRARRSISRAFSEAGTDDPDGFPDTAVPIDEELQIAFLEAYWRNLAWQDSEWLGHRIGRPPTDLFAYQELVHDVRPDWIIEFRTLDGAKALFFATLCDLVGHGQVLSIDQHAAAGRPDHPRITYLEGQSTHDDVAAKAREIVGADARCVVVMNSGGSRMRVVKEIELFEPFVPIGSYLVVEDTIVNGHPVYASFGPGPFEAVRDVTRMRGEFVADPRFERYGVSFNRGGFLRRVK